MRLHWAVVVLLGFLACFCSSQLTAQDGNDGWESQAQNVPPIVMEVVAGSEQKAQTPAGWYVPDEHTAVLPLPGQWGTFLVFTGGHTPTSSGTIVMTTTDFLHFDDASAYGYVSPIMKPLEPRDPGVVDQTECTPANDTLFDDNYSAPGSVFPDPGSHGTWLMLYEAENHCRLDMMVEPFYASVGVARSLDQGQTWPDPAFLSPGYDSLMRYQGASSQSAKPTNNFSYVGDAIPSGLVSDGYVYAYYTDFILGGTYQIEVARARDDASDPLTFWKFDAATGWNTPASSRDGPVPGEGSSLITFPTGFVCGEVGVQEVVLDENWVELRPWGRLFVMTMECDNRDNGKTAAAGVTPQGAWFYSTTRSLERQEWSAPAIISNTLQYIDCTTTQFDGYYPSFVSPLLPPAHLGARGHALYLTGSTLGAHSLAVRDFQITAGTPAPFQALPTLPCAP
jgi:hypothetical protein